MFPLSVWILIVVAILAYIYSRPKQQINLPGPLALPLIGNAWDFEKRLWAVFIRWQRKYGDLIKIDLGNKTGVLVGDPILAKEMLATDVFVGRGYVDEFLLFEGEPLGIINSEGQRWEQQRRFVVRHLRDFGFAKTSMESVIMDEVNELTTRLVQFKGKVIENIRIELQLGIVNALWSIVAGARYNQEDPKLRELSYQLTGAFDDAAKAGGLIAVIPSLKYIFPQWSGYSSIRKVQKSIVEFVTSIIADHQKSFQEESPRDLIDVYLKEMKTTTDPDSSFQGALAEKQLVAVVSDLYQAGAEATSGVLNWGILHLTKSQDIQQKLYEEIVAVASNSRTVSFTDRSKLVYTQAFINELLRKYSSPIGVPHRVLHDVTFKGVFYPKDTTVVINLGHIHTDPKLWGDPDNFRPERFLADDGKSLKKFDNFQLNPFLIGRRQCPGETLAKDTLFLYFTNLIQKFKMVPDPQKPELDLEPGVSFMIVAKPFHVIFQERKE